MTSPRITLTYSGARADRTPTDLLLIEQQEWKPYTGVVTRGEMVNYLASLLYSDTYQSSLDCGLTGNAMVCTLEVYPRRPDLAYQFHASYGTLSERLMETITIEDEACNFELTDTITPKYPPIAVVSAAWLDDCYSAAGEIIAPPVLTIVNGEIHSAVACYGSVTVAYATERHTYILTIPRREEAIDNFWQAVVYGLYVGGLSYHVVEMPPHVLDLADPEAICGRGGDSGSVTWPEDEETHEPRPINVHRIVDYCSQQIASERYY